MIDVSFIIEAVFVVVAILIAIVLHEMMHAWVAHLLGDDTAKNEGRITLNPLPHINPVLTVLLPLVLWAMGYPPMGAAQPVPVNPSRLRWAEYGMAIMALAGPLTNLALAGVATLISWVTDVGGLMGGFLDIFALVNLTFFLVNMIPIPPLDGSRVLYVFMPDSIRSVMLSIERMGLLIILPILLLLFFILRDFL